MALPINIDDLLNGLTVEGARLECKGGWNPEPILHTICAFANDLHNFGGGYIVLGVEEDDGQPVLPPKGLSPGQVDKIQKELLGLCHRITPTYFPVLEPVQVEAKLIVAIWVPGGENRPYKAPVSLAKGSTNASWVRIGSSSVIAKGPLEQELLEVAAKIPFDDRVNHHADISDLSRNLIQTHLEEVRSALAESAPGMDLVQLGRQMRIVGGADENPRPINAGLLFFSDSPERFFDTAWIDVVHMPDGPSGPEIRETRFAGPLDRQLRSALDHIRTHFIEERTIKRKGTPEADRFYTYPYEAVEEALANAVYHRGYDVREPTEVRVTPDEITITSYPGPDPSVRVDAIKTGRAVARRYRNRRVGEFLKELRLTEGRGTGVPTILRAMRENGSPEPDFETDEERLFFTTRLSIHPRARTEDGEQRGGSAKASANVAAKVVLPGTTTREMAGKILLFAREPRSRSELQRHIGVSNISYFLRRHVNPLMHIGLLEYTIPDAPRAPNQQYRTTELGTALLRHWSQA